MKKLNLKDHRAVRTHLTKEDYALHEGPEYRPQGIISREAWRTLNLLPDTVALQTTDYFSRSVPVLQRIAYAWLDIHELMPPKSPMREQCSAAVYGFEAAIFNAVYGWYRLAGIALRCSLEDILVGLYYQNRPNDREEFERIVRGDGGTPGRKAIDMELTKYIDQSLLLEINALYQDELSRYVHRTSDGELWQSNGPIFVAEQLSLWISQYERTFRLLCRLTDAVVGGSRAVAIADSIAF